MLGGTFLSLFTLNLVFYTAYSKQTKRLDMSLLLDVLFFRRGLDHTLVELNKVISLVGLSMFLIGFAAFAWWDRRKGIALLAQATLLLWTHSLYSVVLLPAVKTVFT